ncbi:MAG: sulfite exporter TauE/SafE family protein [Polyangiales bacterium]
MLLTPTMIGFYLIVVFAATVQTAIGFGSTLVCVTLGANLFDIEQVVHWIVPVSFLQTGYVLVTDRREIQWAFLLKRVLPWMIAGVVGGLAIVSVFKGPILGFAFGVIVLALTVRDLHEQSKRSADSGSSLNRFQSTIAMLAAGVMHGMFASGGPMLVYALGREGLDKHAFRATLSVVWFTLNIILVGQFVRAGVYDRENLKILAALSLSVFAGVVVGDWLHHRVDEKRFRIAVLGLLCAAAISLVLRYGRQLF